jgi:predicted short-subunit dehydrogenase-like oxidoreductase (DUF2520 family)
VRELDSIAVVGAGRLGTALTAALRAAGLSVAGPLGREPDITGATLVLLCVPDGEIGAAAGKIAPGPVVGHCSGATTLEPLAGHEALGLHPLMTVPAGSPPEVFRGAAAAVDGTTPRALAAAEELARLLGMRPMRVAPEDRAAYHAAAAIASNFLVALEESAAELLERSGIDDAHELIAPLVLRSAANWAERGPEALTGPIARGDEDTVSRHLDAIGDRAPELLELYEALAARTRAIASERSGALA